MPGLLRNKLVIVFGKRSKADLKVHKFSDSNECNFAYPQPRVKYSLTIALRGLNWVFVWLITFIDVGGFYPHTPYLVLFKVRDLIIARVI